LDLNSKDLAGAAELATRGSMWLEILVSYPIAGRTYYDAYFSSNPATKGRSE
jgi:hypothetical protein